MNAHRSTNRTLGCTAAALAAVAVMLAPAGPASSTPSEPNGPSLNRMEHEARRHLPEVRRDQARTLNTREHLPHAVTAPAVAGPAQPSSSDPCSVLLAQRWSELGHFSDGYETYLLGQPPCV